MIKFLYWNVYLKIDQYFFLKKCNREIAKERKKLLGK